jgi:hypothetical protein
MPATAYSPYSRHHRHLEGWHGLLGLAGEQMPPWVWLPNRTAGPAHVDGTPRATSAMLLDRSNATAAVRSLTDLIALGTRLTPQ